MKNGWCGERGFVEASDFDRLRLQGFVDRLAGQPYGTGDGSDGGSLVEKLVDHRFLLFGQFDPCSSLPAAPTLAFGLRLGDAGQLPFLANFGFVGGDGSQHAGHQPTGWGGEVKAFSQADKADAQDLEFIQQRQQSSGGSAKTIQPPNADLGDFAAANVGQQPFQAGAFHRRAGEAVLVPDDILIGLGFGLRLQVRFLAAGILPLGAADPQVDTDGHAAVVPFGVNAQVSSLPDAFERRKFVISGRNAAGHQSRHLRRRRGLCQENGSGRPRESTTTTRLQRRLTHCRALQLRGNSFGRPKKRNGAGGTKDHRPRIRLLHGHQFVVEVFVGQHDVVCGWLGIVDNRLRRRQHC